MELFHKQNDKLVGLKPKPFKLEKDLQKLFENNLELLTDFKLVKSEFALKNVRFDTLAFDEENQSFVIIEYKRSQNGSVVEQGISYLNLMLEYKAELIVEYNENCGKNLKRNDVDWSQSKIIFVAPSFTGYQKQSSNFKDLPIELWETKQYENDVVVINLIKKSSSAPSIREVQATEKDRTEIANVINEVKVYTEEDHLQGKPDSIKELYEDYKTAILNLSADIEIDPKKLYIAFKKGSNIVDICIQQKKLVFWLNIKSGLLDDTRKLATDVSTKGHHGNGDYELHVSDTNNLEYIMSLIKQGL